MTIYIDLNTLEFPLYQGDVRLRADCGPADAFVLPSGFAEVQMGEAPKCGPEEELIPQKPELINGVWYQNFVKQPVDTAYLAEAEAHRAYFESLRTAVPEPIDYSTMSGSPPNVIA